MIITRILDGYQQLIVESEVESITEYLDIQKHNKYMKNVDKTKNSSYIIYLGKNNLYG